MFIMKKIRVFDRVSAGADRHIEFSNDVKSTRDFNIMNYMYFL